MIIYFPSSFKKIYLLSALLFLIIVIPVSASMSASAASLAGADFKAYKIVDGNLDTKWISASADPQWLEVDANEIVHSDGIMILWENNGAAKEYKVFTSLDRNRWNEVYSTTNGEAGSTEIFFKKTNIQFIKIFLNRKISSGGYSISEIFINGYQGEKNFHNDDLRQDGYLRPEDPMVLEWLKTMQDISTPDKKLVSTQEDKLLHLFNNSLAALAFLVEGEKERGERILDFYAHAMCKDNVIPDLQNFYYKGEARGFFQFSTYEVRNGKPGYYNLFDSDRWMGDMVWLMFAYKYYEKKYGPARYRETITPILNLIISWFKPEGTGPGGYFQHGWIHGDSKLHAGFGHHEGNIDAYALMKLCQKDALAKKVRIWLDQNIQGNDMPLDLYSWRSLAYGKEGNPFLAIPENDPRFRKTVSFNGRTATGFFRGPDANINNIWLDGTGHMACAFFSAGNFGKGCYYANQMDQFLIDRTINGKKLKSIPFAANTTGGYEWVDVKKGNISAVAWYIFAKHKFNPMTLEQNGKPTTRIVFNQAESSNQTVPINISLASNYLIDDFTIPENWNSLSDKDTPAKVQKGTANEGFFPYTLEKGAWVAFQKSDNLPLYFNKGAIHLEIKPEGNNNVFTIKLIDQDGSVFGWSIDMDFNIYKQFTLKPTDFQYLWGGDKNLEELSQCEITIDKKDGGSGSVSIKNFEYLSAGNTIK